MDDDVTPISARFTWWGRLLLVPAVFAIYHGAVLLLTGGARTAPVSSVKWIVGGLVVHDGILAPVVVVVGVVLLRVTRAWPAAARYAVATGLFVAAVLVLVGLFPLLSTGAGGNPTATPRDYGLGLVLSLVTVAVLTAVAVVVAFRPALIRPGRASARRRT